MKVVSPHDAKAVGREAASRRVTLGRVLRRHNEIIHPGDRQSGTAEFVGLEHIQPGTGRRVGSITIDLAKMSGRKPAFRRGQIVYGYLRPYLNKVWIAEFDGCCSVDQFAFDVDRDIAHANFVADFLRSEVFLHRALRVTTPGQLPRISIDEIEAVEVDLPPLAEQERIAQRLTEQLVAVERARTAAEARLAAARALPAAILRDVFEAPQVSVWGTARFGDLVISHDDRREPVRVSDRKPGPFAYYGASGIIDRVDQFLFDGEYLLVAEDGANLVTRATPIAFIARGQFWVNNHAHVVQPKRREHLEFLVSYFAWLDISHVVTGSAQPKLNQAVLHDLPVLLPPESKLLRVSADLSRRLAAAELLIERCREELATVEALPAALLRDAFGTVDGA